MQLTSRPVRSPFEQRRELARRRRAAAASLAQAFPEVERLRITLNFLTSEGGNPAAQTHDVFPPATMILEFACPHGDCDGSFDLTGVAIELLASESTVARGACRCRGSRPAPRSGRQPCELDLQYHVVAIYR